MPSTVPSTAGLALPAEWGCTAAEEEEEGALAEDTPQVEDEGDTDHEDSDQDGEIESEEVDETETRPPPANIPTTAEPPPPAPTTDRRPSATASENTHS